ncbi:bifunctional 2-methylcitrate synthase/citrate synthase [Candidatus Pelagibacter sp.]|jgi:2-methylcitrate synthase|nr:bifunctional 2-methylcitrate synthase/citrate synthase [Candidatus Pelagibacter sp.]MDB3947438.1 bifunctional 2-methylcitrate synthase/citrate synthase [Candidatus Pelagibacter sp.]MDB3970069.1 bifunctional 2-methylcitrate synthase/citrate synthase [Candidatus Pelagibacter sp.]MDB4811345.1 bifunctional 2-methylcitrate synthase/citrate synthase [Candidatus Pelagibacter sp.]MDC0465883.1 bifunctional 2-methylcitrate synthase/citrate synthase [Candidatus Pelagibacter sp.]
MSDEIKKGLLGIVVDETEVSKVMPEINSLTYRGYAAQDLCEYCRFEEVAYLILNKDLPNSIQLKQFEKEEKNNRELSKNLYEIIKHMPKKSHPMDVARTAVSVMGLEDNETSDSSPEANMRKALRIFAKTPTALAAFYRIRNGKKIIKPKKELTFAENFFYMCFGKVPQKEIVKAFDVSLILYAEHSFNVSTFTARTITSSLSDIHGAITGAIASLKGPLHGGANEEVMHMMRKIKKPENALKWINNALKNKEVVMGFGHRVYKSGDSRVPTMREYFGKVAKIKKDKTFEKIYDIVEKVMIKKKNIHPNVDYPTGPTYHLMGFDTDFFTPIFVISRITGWSAHIMEQHAANKLIRPLASYKGSKHRKVMQLNQR